MIRAGVCCRARADEVGGILMVAEHGSEPGDFDRWVNYNFQHGRVTFFLYDHKGDTLREVIDRATRIYQQQSVGRRAVQARQRLRRRARGGQRSHRSLRQAHSRFDAARPVDFLRASAFVRWSPAFCSSASS